MDRAPLPQPDPTRAWIYAGPAARARLAHAVTPEGMAERLAGTRELLLSPARAAEAEDALARDPLRLSLVPWEGKSELAAGLTVSTSGEFVADAGRARLLVAQPSGRAFDYSAARAFMDDFDAARADVASKHPGVTASVTGGHAMNVALQTLFRRDLEVSGTLSVILASLTFLLTFRRARALVAVLPPLAIGTLWTTGLAAFLPNGLSAIASRSRRSSSASASTPACTSTPRSSQARAQGLDAVRGRAVRAQEDCATDDARRDRRRRHVRRARAVESARAARARHLVRRSARCSRRSRSSSSRRRSARWLERGALCRKRVGSPRLVEWLTSATATRGARDRRARVRARADRARRGARVGRAAATRSWSLRPQHARAARDAARDLRRVRRQARPVGRRSTPIATRRPRAIAWTESPRRSSRFATTGPSTAYDALASFAPGPALTRAASRRARRARSAVVAPALRERARDGRLRAPTRARPPSIRSRTRAALPDKRRRPVDPLATLGRGRRRDARRHVRPRERRSREGRARDRRDPRGRSPRDRDGLHAPRRRLRRRRSRTISRASASRRSSSSRSRSARRSAACATSSSRSATLAVAIAVVALCDAPPPRPVARVRRARPPRAPRHHDGRGDVPSLRGARRRISIEHALREQGPLVVATALTTSAGFGALLACNFDGLFDVGAVGAIGSIAGVVAALLVVPAGLALTKRAASADTTSR